MSTDKGAVPNTMSKPYAPPLAPSSLYKQHSWSPDVEREEAWERRKGKSKMNRIRSRSVTEEDLDELKACIELGFGFDFSPEMDQRLSNTLPALGLYHAVNKQYNDSISKSTTAFSSPERDFPSPLGSPLSRLGPGENSQTVKTRLRQWAQVVACSVKHSSS